MLENIDQNPNFIKLSESEYIEELKKKLVEESQEILKEKEVSIEELADIYELLEEFVKLKKTSIDELKSKVDEKREKSGGFEKRYYLKHVEVDDDSKWIDHYHKQPEKYPEIE